MRAACPWVPARCGSGCAGLRGTVPPAALSGRRISRLGAISAPASCRSCSARSALRRVEGARGERAGSCWSLLGDDGSHEAAAVWHVGMLYAGPVAFRGRGCRGHRGAPREVIFLHAPSLCLSEHRPVLAHTLAEPSPSWAPSHLCHRGEWGPHRGRWGAAVGQHPGHACSPGGARAAACLRGDGVGGPTGHPLSPGTGV